METKIKIETADFPPTPCPICGTTANKPWRVIPLLEKINPNLPQRAVPAHEYCIRSAPLAYAPKSNAIVILCAERTAPE